MLSISYENKLYLLVSFAALPIVLALAVPDTARPVVSVTAAPPAAVPPVEVTTPRRAWLLPRVAIPAGCFVYGVATMNHPGQRENYFNAETREEMRENFPRFRTRIDNYTRHAPTAAAYVLPLLGVKGHYNAANFTLVYLSGRLLNDGLTSQLKKRVGEWRPGATPDQRSFPSAHTSEAFFSATLLYEQYREQNPWIGAGGFAVAAATGTMRMLNDKHWLSDVVAGAGIGIISAETAWYAYPWLQRRIVSPLARKVMIMPLAGPRFGGVSVAIRN